MAHRTRRFSVVGISRFLSWYIEFGLRHAENSEGNRGNTMDGSRRQLLTRGLAAAAAISTSSSAFAQLPWNRRGQAPTEADYFHGTAFDHGVETVQRTWRL